MHHSEQQLQCLSMNWYDIQKLEALQIRLNKLGYMMLQSKWSTSGSYTIGVYPLDDKNPLFTRDAEVFSGDTEHIASWVKGIEHQNNYLMMMKATSEKKIKDLEEKYIKERIQKGMLQKISDPNKKLDQHTEDFIKLRAK